MGKRYVPHVREIQERKRKIMQIILLEDVKTLGKKGDIVEVSIEGIGSISDPVV